jgi:hypothetical protein
MVVSLEVTPKIEQLTTLSRRIQLEDAPGTSVGVILWATEPRRPLIRFERKDMLRDMFVPSGFVFEHDGTASPAALMPSIFAGTCVHGGCR